MTRVPTSPDSSEVCPHRLRESPIDAIAATQPPSLEQPPETVARRSSSSSHNCDTPESGSPRRPRWIAGSTVVVIEDCGEFEVRSKRVQVVAECGDAYIVGVFEL